MLLAIAGSLLATFVLRKVGHYNEAQSAGWLASFVGAFVLLAIYHLFKRARSAWRGGNSALGSLRYS